LLAIPIQFGPLHYQRKPFQSIRLRLPEQRERHDRKNAIHLENGGASTGAKTGSAAQATTFL
jgi:hypothetical protein